MCLEYESGSTAKNQSEKDVCERDLNIIYEMLDKYHSEHLTKFNQIPFKKILNAFLVRFYRMYKDLDTFNESEKLKKKNDMLTMFANLFKKLSPSKFPAFAFSWLELISSPYFMPQMLTRKIEFNLQERWFKMQELFNLLFVFLKENIYENSANSPALEKFFEGAMKICVVVLHDYPEFFNHYYFFFVNQLPLYRINNLRNTILAAFPKNIRLPDPSAEIVEVDNSRSNFEQDKQALLHYYVHDAELLKNELDEYLETESEATMKKICERLEKYQVVRNSRKIINTGIVHATILYLAQDIEQKSIHELGNPDLFKKFELM
jgi:hypothetical protein